MKKLSFLMMLAALGMFSLGCEPQKASKPAAETSSDNVTSDTGEEKPAAPAAEAKPEEKKEEKPAEPAPEAKPEEKPTTEEKAAEEKPAEEKPAEEKPAEAPKQ